MYTPSRNAKTGNENLNSTYFFSDFLCQKAKVGYKNTKVHKYTGYIMHSSHRKAKSGNVNSKSVYLPEIL